MAGYMNEIDYTFGYFHELNPLSMNLAFANAGLAHPDVKVACELGFGQGISGNVHAAAGAAEWFGTDFNPSQAAFARELARIAGSGAAWFDQTFGEFCSRPDLPDFDFVALHGIWSWISDADRAVLVDFVRRKLKVGGVLYLSYNALPGWATRATVQHLVRQHAYVLGAKGTALQDRIGSALDFVERLAAVHPRFLDAAPGVAEWLKNIKTQDRRYVAHEYFGAEWHPMYFADVAAQLSPAKLSFACSAHYLDHVDAINLLPAQQEFLNHIPHAVFREAVRDTMVNASFRRDYWVKGPRHLPPGELIERVRDHKILLLTPPDAVPSKMSGALGEGQLNSAVLSGVVACLADHRVRTIGHIESALRKDNINLQQIVVTVMALTSGGHIAAAQEAPATEKARPRTDRLNEYLLRRAPQSAEITVLASPVTGGGLPLAHFGQLFLHSVATGERRPTEMARSAWEPMRALGKVLMKDKAPIRGDEQNLKALEELAAEFLAKKLPILRAAGVAAD